jgi:putative superfamily III holin-X
MTDHTSVPRAGDAHEASLGELVARMSEQTSRLIRDEMRLAQAEMTAKGKAAGLGAGLFGGAGLFALYGLACLVTAAILALAGPVPDWLAAVIVGVALFVVAGVAALIGKREVTAATPPVPEEAVRGVKQDVQTLKSGSNA